MKCAVSQNKHGSEKVFTWQCKTEHRAWTPPFFKVVEASFSFQTQLLWSSITGPDGSHGFWPIRCKPDIQQEENSGPLSLFHHKTDGQNFHKYLRKRAVLWVCWGCLSHTCCKWWFKCNFIWREGGSSVIRQERRRRHQPVRWGCFHNLTFVWPAAWKPAKRSLQRVQRSSENKGGALPVSIKQRSHSQLRTPTQKKAVNKKTKQIRRVGKV